MGRTRNVGSGRQTTEASRSPAILRNFPRMPALADIHLGEEFTVDGVDEMYVRRGKKFYKQTLTEV